MLRLNIFIAVAISSVICQRTVWDTIREVPELNQFRKSLAALPSVQQRLRGSLGSQFTVFAYTDDAYNRAMEDGSASFLTFNSNTDATKYHIVEWIGPNRVDIWDLRSRDRVLTLLNTPIYTTTLAIPDPTGLPLTTYFVNNAQVLARDYQRFYTSSNGIVYLIDRVLLPVGSNQTILEYLQRPENKVTKFASMVDKVMRADRNFEYELKQLIRGTALVPTDRAFESISKQDRNLLNDINILKTVVKSHFSFGRVYFSRIFKQGNEYPMSHSKLVVEEDGVQYCHIGCYTFKAKLNRMDLPMMNGVIHFVDTVDVTCTITSGAVPPPLSLVLVGLTALLAFLVQ